jgi:hypothetical protein
VKAFLAKLMAVMTMQVLISTRALLVYGVVLLLSSVVFDSVGLAILGGFLIYYSRSEEQKPIA